MKRFFLGLLVIPSVLLLGGLFGSSYVSAASNYDNYIVTTDTPAFKHESCETVPFNNDLLIELMNDDKYWSFGNYQGDRSTYAQSLQNAFDNGSYLIMETHAGLNSRYAITVAWSVSGLTLTWDQWEVKATDVLGNTFKYVNFQISPTWGCEIQAWGPGETYSQSIGSPNNKNTGEVKIYNASTNFEMNYPENYEGETLPTTNNAQASDWKPEIKLHRGTNWEVELSDYNFFNIDKPPFLCGPDELAPIINWEVWDITDNDNRVLIDTLVFGAPSVVTYKAPKIQQDKKYELVAWYSDCQGYNFTSANTKQFTVKKDGNLKSTDLAAVCIMDEAPFINIPNCIGDINDLLATLAFRTPSASDIGGGGFLTLVNGCRELQVLGGWIQAPNATVCPKMPAHVRSTITPFIVFGLALLAIMVISRRGGSTV